MAVLILILLVLIYIAYAVSNLGAPNLVSLESTVDDIKSDILEMNSAIGRLANDVESIENAVRSSKSGWLDEYELRAETSEHPPVGSKSKRKD